MKTAIQIAEESEKLRHLVRRGIDPELHERLNSILEMAGLGVGTTIQLRSNNDKILSLMNTVDKDLRAVHSGAVHVQVAAGESLRYLARRQ